MRKITMYFLGSLFLMLSCNKQDANLANEETALEPTEVSLRNCASNEILEAQIAADPQRGRNLEELEAFTQNYKGRALENGRADVTLYIPVVVNIILPNASQVTDAQIQTQIDVLNKDFSKSNSELSNTGVYLAGYDYNNVANCKLQYVVKLINRKNNTTTTTFGTNDAVKKTSQGGLDPTYPTTHLNMWVCDLSGGYLGYAQFPGGNAATDGVVIDYQAFGTSASYPMYASFNLGRTATHEIGHWLNLRHIWGDRRCGDDYVGDTPAHDASNGGCPAINLKSNCAGKPLEQWMNYMDYTDDRCMYMFSGGQKTRMDAAIDGSRKSYVTTTP